jgi:hypothetical protein
VQTGDWVTLTSPARYLRGRLVLHDHTHSLAHTLRLTLRR